MGASHSRNQNTIDDYDYTEPLGVGSIQQLNDHTPTQPTKKIPLGFPIPKPKAKRGQRKEHATTKSF